MEPNEFSTVVNTLLKMLSDAAPQVYAAARQSVLTWVWRDMIVVILIQIAWTVSSVYCIREARTFALLVEQLEDRWHKDEQITRSSTWSAAGIALGIGAIIWLAIVVATAANLFRLDYLTLKEVIYLIPGGK